MGRKEIHFLKGWVTLFFLVSVYFSSVPTPARNNQRSLMWWRIPRLLANVMAHSMALRGCLHESKLNSYQFCWNPFICLHESGMRCSSFCNEFNSVLIPDWNFILVWNFNPDSCEGGARFHSGIKTCDCIDYQLLAMLFFFFWSLFFAKLSV